MDIILSNYFTTKKDPQRKIYWNPDNEKIIMPWIETLTNLGLNGIIFHDSLSSDFIEKFKDYNVSFVYYKLKTYLSVNDERFLCWYEFLKDNPQYDKVFTTDLFDVKFNKNPFDLICDDYDIYADALKGRTVTDNERWRKPMKIIYGQLHCENKPLVNAGVVGATRNNMLKLLSAMVNDFETYNTPEKSKLFHEGDIPVMNKHLWSLFKEERLMLSNVTSEFKKYETHGDFAIFHK